MSHTMKSEVVPNGTPGLHCGPRDSRTRLMSYLADPVLPVITLLCISALTVTVIVVMVTAIATAFIHSQAERGTAIDPWMGVSSTAGRPYDDEPTYPGDLWLESQPYDRFDAASVARWTPRPQAGR